MRQVVPRVELCLIIAMATGGALILQRWSFGLFQTGLVLMLGATLLNIAVGNLPRDASAARALLLTALILGILALVFGAGILLVPALSRMGQDS